MCRTFLLNKHMVGSMVPTTKYLGEWRSKILLSVDLTSFDNVNTSSLAIQIEFTAELGAGRNRFSPAQGGWQWKREIQIRLVGRGKV